MCDGRDGVFAGRENPVTIDTDRHGHRLNTAISLAERKALLMRSVKSAFALLSRKVTKARRFAAKGRKDQNVM